ncbi:long-chain fatty acid--CoA ligase [Alkalicaulis satelles]|uniref:Long-chain fatty acid--CoA ligase n=1 Tax=Alkalicaulis satelles TaxID=2609175 RepID=A0A5M6ZQ69_9PROT|nr:AMP-binding protein [Alkalicaulis satelles]KAA5805398.1 long-chain fatty acid--CoA ligase [Alkalicaulis satelles]
MIPPVLRFMESAARWPDRPALQDDLGARLTHGELASRAAALAAGLQKRLGDNREAIVALAAKNHADHVVAMFGIFLAGYAWLPLNPRSAPALNIQICETLRPSLVLLDEACKDCVNSSSLPAALFRAGDRQGLDALSADAGQWRAPALAPDHVMSVKLTGGTTGRPKAVAQTQRVIATAASDLAAVFAITGEDVNLAAAPLSHGAFHLLLPVLIAGGRHVIASDLSPEALLDAMEREGVTLAFMPPTLIIKLSGSGLARPERFPALRELIYSAAPMPPAQIRRAWEAFGPKIAAMYGQVEAPMALAAMTAGEMAGTGKLESAGRACPSTQLRILGPDPDGTGEIAARGPLVAPRYLTGEPLDIEDGWLKTGDLGRIDPDGHVFIRGRSREMLITGGFNVYPAEVERALLSVDGVTEACVFGVADPYWGERVEAAIVAQPGVDDEALREAVKAAIGAVAAPKAIHRIEALPRNPVGKVVRREVAALFSACDGA